jgi:hypothetical protein
MDFRPGCPVAECCRLGRRGFGVKKELKSSFGPEGAAPKCPSRLGGLEITGSRVHDTPSEILSALSFFHFRRLVGSVSHNVGLAGFEDGLRLPRKEASMSETNSCGP